MSTFCELTAYVTGTEWGWMHGITTDSKITEVDLERPEVYVHLQTHASYTDEWEYALLARGSLATLKTDIARECLKRCVEPRIFLVAGLANCMKRPLCVVQYYVHFLLEIGTTPQTVLDDVCGRAILYDRRDVIVWMCVEFPNVLETKKLFETVYINALYNRQSRIMRWMSKRYALPKGHMCEQWVCLVAVAEQQFKILRWLRRGPSKCPWNQPKCLAEAEKHGYDEIANWIRRQSE